MQAIKDDCPVCGTPTEHWIPAYIDPFIRERCQIGAGEQARAHYCEACDHHHFTPLLEGAQLERLYSGYRGPEYTAQRGGFDPSYPAHAADFDDPSGAYRKARKVFYDQHFQDLRGLTGLVVDYGGGDGEFARYVFPNARVVVVEESFERDGGDLAALLTDAAFLFCAHVFEHTPRPFEIFGRLASLLPTGAGVWLEVPLDYSDTLGRSFTDLERSGDHTYRSQLQLLHEHIAHYSASSVERLLTRAGLNVVRAVRSTFANAVLGRSGPAQVVDASNASADRDLRATEFRKGLPVVFDSPNIRVVFQAGSPDSDASPWVTFGSRMAREACCTGFIGRLGAPAFHIFSKTDDWYDSVDAWEAAGFVARRLNERGGRPIVFGASMGGYGAVLHSQVLDPAIMMLGYPQVLVDDDASAGKDDRWRRQWAALDAQEQLRTGLAELASGPRVSTIYDPFVPEDLWQARKLGDRPGLHHVRLPFTGHEVFVELAKAGFSSRLEHAMVCGGPDDVEAITREFRRTRRDRLHYWVWLGQVLLRRRRSLLAAWVYWEVVQRWPTDSFAYFFLAEALEELGRRREAASVLSAGLDVSTSADEIGKFTARIRETQARLAAEP